MSLRIAIIGAGWYGCHIASSLAALGCEITIFERASRVMHEASGNNQFRLHLGFHYPRHHGTRLQSRDGFSRFLERYPDLTAEVRENIYAVAADESLLDFASYRLAMMSSGIEFKDVPSASVPLTNIDGMLATGERVLMLARARAHFTRILGPFLRLGTPVESVVQGDGRAEVNGEAYDYVVDATWGHFRKPKLSLYYEPTLLLYYEAAEPFPAVTLVDGPLCSIYPTEDPRIYTLSSVVHTPLGRFDEPLAAHARRAAVDQRTVEAKRLMMEEQISRYVPGFLDNFEFLGPQFSIKTKPNGKFDDRSCYVFHEGRVITVFSGKIDTVFFAMERVLSIIEHDRADATLRQESGIRAELASAYAGKR